VSGELSFRLRLVHEFSIASVPGRLDGYVAAAVIHVRLGVLISTAWSSLQ
jgi:hypothetical protein